jgi:tight adherence protein C
MTPSLMLAFAFIAAACGCVLFSMHALSRLSRMQHGAHTLDHALDQRAARASAPAARDGTTNTKSTGKKTVSSLLDAFSRAALHWLDTPLGAIIVAPEDRRLLERCGYVDAVSRARFLAARMACAVIFPLALIASRGAHAYDVRSIAWGFAALTVGFLLPKWVIKRRAKARQRAVANELPMFVDLLRLLQGVGLSLDQTLQVMITDFATIMPVLAGELTLAHRQFTTGRTREQSLTRLATGYENDDLNAVMRLLVQVDKHGGAVQEPLRQFGDRLRETRRSGLRERIGMLTVKMTGVMVVTLLPALLIMTAGPGFLAVIHSLATMRH